MKEFFKQIGFEIIFLALLCIAAIFGIISSVLSSWELYQKLVVVSLSILVLGWSSFSIGYSICAYNNIKMLEDLRNEIFVRNAIEELSKKEN